MHEAMEGIVHEEVRDVGSFVSIWLSENMVRGGRRGRHHLMWVSMAVAKGNWEG